jgi:hypothetical protein
MMRDNLIYQTHWQVKQELEHTVARIETHFFSWANPGGEAQLRIDYCVREIGPEAVVSPSASGPS